MILTGYFLCDFFLPREQSIFEVLRDFYLIIILLHLYQIEITVFRTHTTHAHTRTRGSSNVTKVYQDGRLKQCSYTNLIVSPFKFTSHLQTVIASCTSTIVLLHAVISLETLGMLCILI